MRAIEAIDSCDVPSLAIDLPFASLLVGRG
jgi:hypothetical protein